MHDNLLCQCIMLLGSQECEECFVPCGYNKIVGLLIVHRDEILLCWLPTVNVFLNRLLFLLWFNCCSKFCLSIKLHLFSSSQALHFLQRDILFYFCILMHCLIVYSQFFFCFTCSHSTGWGRLFLRNRSLKEIEMWNSGATSFSSINMYHLIMHHFRSCLLSNLSWDSFTEDSFSFWGSMYPLTRCTHEDLLM